MQRKGMFANTMKKQRIAIVPGSFDPATKGHADIIRRAARIFDKVYPTVMVNAEKLGSEMFTPEERLAILKSACRDLGDNIECLMCSSLASDFADSLGASYFVKGVRGATDFDYEYSMAEIMRRFDSRIETILLPASPELAHISSTYARERIKYGCELSDVTDSRTAQLIREIYGARK